MARQRKSKVKPKTKPKAKPKTYGKRVAVYFSKSQLNLLEWARAHAAKQGVGLNRLVLDGLRAVHELETGDVHYDPNNPPKSDGTPQCKESVVLPAATSG